MYRAPAMEVRLTRMGQLDRSRPAADAVRFSSHRSPCDSRFFPHVQSPHDNDKDGIKN